MHCRLRSATLPDLGVVLRWIGSPEQLQSWGLSGTLFPPEAARIWSLIGADAGTAFVLADRTGQVVGFGQAVPRTGEEVHLVRIIVAPALRGRGMGRLLCLALMERAVRRWHPLVFTLKVFEDNGPAVSLYRSLGFREYPAETSGTLLAMSAPGRVPAWRGNRWPRAQEVSGPIGSRGSPGRPKPGSCPPPVRQRWMSACPWSL